MRNLTYPITIHVPVAEADAIEAAAKAAGISRAAFCKRGIRREVDLAQHSKPALGAEEVR
jgi:hypothetical protein